MAFITSPKSQFDKLPNEIVSKILSSAMVRDTPFDIGDCIHTATAVETSVKSEHKFGSQKAEIDRYLETSAEAFRSEELTTPLIAEGDEGRRNKTDGEKSGSQWQLYDASIETQQQHLQDWRLAGSVCSRIRKLGKEAFFSSKVFAMDLTLAKGLHARSLSRLSTEDQQTASEHIISIILKVDNLQTPSTFINLPSCTAGFPNLEHLDFFFGGRKGEPLAWMITATKNRMQPPSHFHGSLTAIGMPTDKIAMGILISPDSKWSVHERLLKSNVYPMLRAWATMKLGKESKKADG